MFDVNKINLGDIITYSHDGGNKYLIFMKGPKLCRLINNINEGTYCNKGPHKTCSSPIGGIWLGGIFKIGCNRLKGIKSSEPAKPAKPEQILLIASKVKNEEVREILKQILKDRL